MTPRARLVGINHVALEVGDLEEALALYSRLFEFELRGRVPGMAFIDMGDQFLALGETDDVHVDQHRHFGLVVDDVNAVHAAVEREGLEMVEGRRGGPEFLDPWGNRIQIVDYREVQFERTPAVKRKLGSEGFEKSDEARRELAEKGLSEEG